MLLNIPLAEDDIDESLELPSPPIVHASNSDTEACIKVEDALGELETTEAATSTLQEQKVNAHPCQQEAQVKGTSIGGI